MQTIVLNEVEIGTLLDVLEDARTRQEYSDMGYIDALHGRFTALWNTAMLQKDYRVEGEGRVSTNLY